MLTIEKVSKILYDVDPGGTLCKENNLTDEYDTEAKRIVFEVNTLRESLYDSVSSVVSNSFSPIKIDDEKISKIVELLKEV